MNDEERTHQGQKDNRNGNSGRKTPEELLDWLCWLWAKDGERFYPPDETAEECVAELEKADDYSRGWEHGYHARAWTEAVERFRDLEKLGFDPKQRAEREIQRSREEGLEGISDLTWSWYDDR